MKYLRGFFSILMLVFLFANIVIGVAAINTGFSTEPVTDDDSERFIKNINLSTLTSEPKKKPIVCFDVSDDEMIAIGCGTSTNKTVCIYTSDGDFQYGFRFECDGTFGVELDGDVLLIYFVRSDIALGLTSDGEIHSISKIENSKENNSYWNYEVFSTKREVNGKTYTIKNKNRFTLASTYSQLIIDDNNEKTVFYDASQIQSFVITIQIVLICVIIFVTVLSVLWRFGILKH